MVALKSMLYISVANTGIEKNIVLIKQGNNIMKQMHMPKLACTSKSLTSQVGTQGPSSIQCVLHWP